MGFFLYFPPSEEQVSPEQIQHLGTEDSLPYTSRDGWLVLSAFFLKIHHWDINGIGL